VNEERRTYERLLVEREHRVRSSPSPDRLDVAGYGRCLMFFGRFREALDAFWLANRLADMEAPLEGSRGTYFEVIGTLYWLLQDRSKAIQMWRAACDGILDGTIRYADLAGGAEQGLLLWYGAVTQGDQAQLAFARKYLRRLARRKMHITAWPGPLALHLLGQVSCGDVLLAGRWGTSELSKAITMSRADILARREIIDALFYFGVKYRTDGEEDQCKDMLRLCASLENPGVEDEWYLARHELGLPMLADP